MQKTSSFFSFTFPLLLLVLLSILLSNSHSQLTLFTKCSPNTFSMMELNTTTSRIKVIRTFNNTLTTGDIFPQQPIAYDPATQHVFITSYIVSLSNPYLLKGIDAMTGELLGIKGDSFPSLPISLEYAHKTNQLFGVAVDPERMDRMILVEIDKETGDFTSQVAAFGHGWGAVYGLSTFCQVGLRYIFFLRHREPFADYVYKLVIVDTTTKKVVLLSEQLDYEPVNLHIDPVSHKLYAAVYQEDSLRKKHKHRVTTKQDEQVGPNIDLIKKHSATEAEEQGRAAKASNGRFMLAELSFEDGSIQEVVHVFTDKEEIRTQSTVDGHRSTYYTLLTPYNNPWVGSIAAVNLNDSTVTYYPLDTSFRCSTPYGMKYRWL